MTAMENIDRFLCQNVGNAYCDDCLSSVLKIMPRQQVQQKTQYLANDHRFRRSPGRCERCGADKLVISRRMVAVA